MNSTDSVKEAVGSTLAARSDDDLMLLTRNGHADAFDVLVLRYRKRLLRSARRYLGSAALAQEAAQNAVFQLYRSVPSYSPQGKLACLLWRILINECRQMRRRRQSERRALELVAQSPPGPSPHLDHRLVTAERHQRVHESLAQLSEKLRSVLVLRFVTELSYDEIAAVLEIPVGTVKSRIAAGLDKLRGDLKGNPP